MQIPQTSYSLFAAVALAGMLADGGPSDKASGLAESTLDSGLFCTKGTRFDTVTALTQTTDVSAHLSGVVQATQIKEPKSPHYAIGDAVNVVKKGRIWVPVVTTTVADDATGAATTLYIIHTGADAGKIRGDANASATAAPVGIKVLQGATAGNLALVEVNLP